MDRIAPGAQDYTCAVLFSVGIEDESSEQARGTITCAFPEDDSGGAEVHLGEAGNRGRKTAGAIVQATEGRVIGPQTLRRGRGEPWRSVDEEEEGEENHPGLLNY